MKRLFTFSRLVQCLPAFVNYYGTKFRRYGNSRREKYVIDMFNSNGLG